MGDFRETLYTIDKRGNRKWVYPSEIKGFFRKRRTIVACFLLLFYLILPWLTINGMQAVHLDIAHRRFVIFGQIFWATDTKFLFLTLVSLAISLFFFTSIFGRVWCGWACPETIFLEFVFRPIEILIEGNASARKALDKSPWNLNKIRKKFLKYAIFSLIAWILASTVLAYFIGREHLIAMMSDYPWHNLSTFMLTLALMGGLLFQFGWFREQFCTVVCPYARFQSVLLDDSSLLVGYDKQRGEPRGKASDPSKGDCVDCGLCVRVCPTGIDIRNGLQLECIQCAQCADACDSIMQKLGRKSGLVRYDTEKGLAGSKTKLIRPRVVLYAGILFSLLSILAYSLGTRSLSDLQILHAKGGELFVISNQGKIENHLELHVANKSNLTKFYSISIPDSEDFKLVVPLNPYPVPAGKSAKVPVFVSFDKQKLILGKLAVNLLIKDENGRETALKITLIGPG